MNSDHSNSWLVNFLFLLFDYLQKTTGKYAQDRCPSIDISNILRVKKGLARIVVYLSYIEKLQQLFKIYVTYYVKPTMSD